MTTPTVFGTPSLGPQSKSVGCKPGVALPQLVYIFLDLSNIMIGAQEAAAGLEDPLAARDVRVSAEALIKVAARGRPVGSALTAVGRDARLEGVLHHYKRAGFTVVQVSRGSTHREIGVDEALQSGMWETLECFRPGIVVLLSGDGAGYAQGRGFHVVLEEMHTAGWAVELAAWQASCNTALAEWVGLVGQVTLLDDVYLSVTFLEGVRRPAPVRLTAPCLRTPVRRLPSSRMYNGPRLVRAPGSVATDDHFGSG